MATTILIVFFGLILLLLGYTILKKDPSNEVVYQTNENGEENENETEEEIVLDPIEAGENEVEVSETELTEEEEYLFKGTTLYPTFALIFGNSTTNPATYGSDNKLNGVATDLKRIHALLKGYGNIRNSHNELLTNASKDTFNNSKATSLEYQMAIKRIATFGKAIKGKKVLFLYESGHGGQVLDRQDNDVDKLAETRCFYDKVVKDDETRDFLTKTLGGDWVIINVVDRCHSGGLARFTAPIPDGSTIKSIGVVDKSLLRRLKKPKEETESVALLKIQSAAKEGTYAMDYGASVGGLFTSKWIEGITAKKGKISYLDANKYAEKKCGTTQVPELAEALNQDHTEWSDKSIFLT